ncbi:MAG: CDGSH-type Zn-finger protein [Gammaproteobacteria bacterium]|jgi:CDGSH-type Zn-finger protein
MIALMSVMFILQLEGNMMSKAIRASDTPYAVEVESGKNYFWCSCGKSGKQPFCDGSHGGTGFTPVKYMATESKKMFFCGCKSTASQPMCDGSHK